MNKIYLYLNLLVNDLSAQIGSDMWSFVWIFIIPIVVLIPLIYFFKLQGAIIGVLLLSLVSAYFYGYLASYGKSEIALGQVALGFVASALLLSFMSYGILFTIDYFKTGDVNKLTAGLWLAILILAPVTMYMVNFLPRAHKVANYISLNFNITSHSLYPIYIDELKFINSKRGTTFIFTDIFKKNSFDEFLNIDQFFKLSLKKRYLIHEKHKTSFEKYSHSPHRFIPYDTDAFTLSWYSFVDDKYYFDSFAFPMSIHDSKNTDYDQMRYIRNLTLHIFPGGNALLLNDLNFNIHNFNSIREVSLTEAKKLQFLADFKSKAKKSKLKEALKSIEKSGFLSELLHQKKYFNWSISLKKQVKVESLKINDFKHNEYKSILNEKNRGSLPRIITLRVGRFTYQFFLNEKVLFNTVVNILGNQSDDILEIAIDLNEYLPKSSTIFVGLKGSIQKFNAFEIYKTN